MTGFASLEWISEDVNYSLELKSVNGRGLDIRSRFPEGFDALEAQFKSNLAGVLNRGNVSLNLRKDSKKTDESFQINRNFLKSVLISQEVIQKEAETRGISLAASKASDYLKIKGVLEYVNLEELVFEKVTESLLTNFNKVLTNFLESRALEGAELKNILLKNIELISGLLKKIDKILIKRQVHLGVRFKNNLSKIIENVDQIDKDRVAQELALLTVKSDVSEEVDRLHSHVKSAKNLINSGLPSGRKLDFLLQEFNRETNTLCSKANNIGLTEIGLDLKVVIDQLREQVQNVE
jgi:uncharacterized protein (TIGR00255 family)